GYVVGEKIKGAAGAEVEAGVMPVTGENTVVDAASIQGEAHVRTAVVHGVDLALVGKEGQHVAAHLHRVDAGLLHVGQGGNALVNERLCLVHGWFLSESRLCADRSLIAQSPTGSGTATTFGRTASRAWRMGRRESA